MALIKFPECNKEVSDKAVSWGSGDSQNVCQKCGYEWTPGKRW